MSAREQVLDILKSFFGDVPIQDRSVLNECATQIVNVFHGDSGTVPAFEAIMDRLSITEDGIRARYRRALEDLNRLDGMASHHVVAAATRHMVKTNKLFELVQIYQGWVALEDARC